MTTWDRDPSVTSTESLRTTWLGFQVSELHPPPKGDASALGLHRSSRGACENTGGTSCVGTSGVGPYHLRF